MPRHYVLWRADGLDIKEIWLIMGNVEGEKVMFWNLPIAFRCWNNRTKFTFIAICTAQNLALYLLARRHLGVIEK